MTKKNTDTFDLNYIYVWRTETFLYAWIDANGMRGNSEVKEKFDLGNDHIVDVRINNFSKKPLSNHDIVKTDEFVFSLNFRVGDMQPWLRIDNESKDRDKPQKYLHFHLEDDTHKFNEHQELGEKYTVAELFSFTFDWVRELVKHKFPSEIVHEDRGFVGFA